MGVGIGNCKMTHGLRMSNMKQNTVFLIGRRPLYVWTGLLTTSMARTVSFFFFFYSSKRILFVHLYSEQVTLVLRLITHMLHLAFKE